MEQNLTQLCDLDPMKDDTKILVRCISIWKSHPLGKPNEVWSLDAVLQDEQGNRVQATIKGKHISKFQLLLDEGACYRIGNLGVGENSGKWPLLNHKFKLNFFQGTTVTRVGSFDNNPHGFKFEHFTSFTSRTLNQIPVSSSSLTGSDGANLDSQVLSPIDRQQNNKGHLDESHTNPNLSTSGQVSVATSSGSPQSMTSSTEKLRTVNTASFGSAASIETLLAAAESSETSIETPPSDIQDKISLIINNLSAANIDIKAKECKEILDEQYYTWFAQYLVMKRVSMEPNFHMLYIDFVAKINSKHLNKELVEASYRNCKVLLNSPLIKSSDKERKLLKNLGGWIGKITIGKNKVLRAIHIDPKSLIMEAYRKGLMIGVIPFTSKILESCKNSLAYQPPNPWTMAILGLLAEIHAMKNLKANLKFEIEILFKNLDVDMKEVTPSSLLKNRVRIVEGNPDFSNNSFSSYQKQKDKVNSNSTVRSVVNQVNSPVMAAGPSDQAGHTYMPPPAAGASYQSHLSYQDADKLYPPTVMMGEEEKKATLGSPNQLPPAQGLQVAQFQNVIPSRAPIIPDLELVRLNSEFPRAMKTALEELVSTIVKRSVCLATTTTIELILKDYSTELDDDHILSASCMMVSRLAGELSYVTSKEPLRQKLSTNLRNSLRGVNVANYLIEHAMQPVIDENLESGCEFIEKAAIDEGKTIVKREITKKLSDRRKHREAFHPRPDDFSILLHYSGKTYINSGMLNLPVVHPHEAIGCSLFALSHLAWKIVV
ncbi:CCR4-NOT complex component [Tanacetum coccineum]|uniref:CCR4-NOT complex component n=1 Tax=Tanacetum coccineum TaxID=301880 RepID=A0ABQ4ZRG3_9ASTR